MGEWLAVDFGTSNSAAAYVENGRVCRVHLERTADTIPTAVFFPADRGNMTVGSVATAAMMDGLEGRYMRSLKSVLGIPLMAERRMVSGRKLNFYEIISGFLRIIKERSETQSGRYFDKVVAGRPVFFDSENLEKDARAKSDLEQCYKMAGFEEIVFLPEPEAAALSMGASLGSVSAGMVVDIGGGTSDFSVFQKTESETHILSSNGFRLGGTNFDRAINLEFIMPHLGYRHPIRPKMSSETLIAPNAIFVDLATWQKISFLYDQKTQMLVKELVRDAVEPTLFKRLQRVIDLQLGHEIAFLAERAKVASNIEKEKTAIDLSLLEPELKVELKTKELNTLLQPFANTLVNAMRETLDLIELDGADVTHVVPVGGSSLMGLVQTAIALVAPKASVVDAQIFTAIVDGLANYIDKNSLAG